MLKKSKDQGSTADESAAEKLDHGVCTDVPKDHPCLSAAADWSFTFFKKRK